MLRLRKVEQEYQQLKETLLLYPKLPVSNPVDWTDDQRKELQVHLTAPIVTAYFQHLANDAMFMVVTSKRLSSPAELEDHSAKLNYLNGVLEVCQSVINYSRSE